MGMESRAREQKENGVELMVCEDTNHGVRKQSERTERERCRTDGL
jgi:predicted peroxiredoxin